MKFGAFDHLDRGIVSTAEQYEERLRLVEAYEESGWFHAFHMTEHHGTPLGMAPCPSIFLAAVAQRHDDAALRHDGAYSMAAYHPYRLYEEICMLDQMSFGRLELGIGRGVSPIELSFVGVPDAKTADEMFAESLEILMLRVRRRHAERLPRQALPGPGSADRDGAVSETAAAAVVRHLLTRAHDLGGEAQRQLDDQP